MFGDDLLINPITTQMEEGKLFATQATWLPEVDWFELCSGTMLQGGQTVERDFTITELPVYAKAGSIIPMQEVMNRVVDNPADPLVLKLVPGERGTTTLYEDEGDNNNFKAGDFTNTTISAFHQGWYSRVVIDPVKGKFEGMLKKRAYKLQFLNTLPPKTVRVNGKELKFSNDKAKGSWYYDAKELSTVVYTDSYNTNKTKEIELVFPKPAPELLDGKKGQMARMYEFSKFLTDNRYSWNDGYYSRNVVLKTAQAPLIISRDIDSAVETLTQFEAGFAKTAEMLEAVSTDKDIFKPYSELMNR